MIRTRFITMICAAALVCVATSSVYAQVGKGIADLNSMPEAALAALPNVTPAIAKALVAKRPFASIVDANAWLLSQGLTQAQATELYGKAFVHVNLNTATREEILLIPGAGNRMTRDHLLVESSDHGFGPDRCGGRIALRNSLTACRDCQQRKTGEPHWPGWLEDPHARLL